MRISINDSNMKTKLKSFRFLIIAFQFLANLNFPQQNSLRFENFTINNGLSNNSINCILQTQDGFLWIATKDGLNRFDGQNFKIYKNDPNNKQSLPENYVMSLFESKDGTFWVGTWGGGLCKFNPINESFTPYDLEYTDDDYIQALFEDHQNFIWYGTTSGGLNRLNPKTTQIIIYRPRLPAKNNFPDENIASIDQDEKNNLWIGTWNSGLVKFNPAEQSFIQFKSNPSDKHSISNNRVWNIFNNGDGTLLLSTYSGMDIFNTSTNEIDPYSDVLQKFNINFTLILRQIIKDRKGNLWIGSYNYLGLFLIQNNHSQNNIIRLMNEDDDNNSLISNRVRWLYEDRSDNLWVGTEEGLSKLPSYKPFIQYLYNPISRTGLGGKVVSSITGNKKGTVWVGFGGGGFDRIDLNKNAITHFKNVPGNSNSLSVNDVVSLYLDRKGILWIGTLYGGLNRFDPVSKKFKVYLHNPKDSLSIASNWVQQIIETSNSSLLVGTNDGLQIFDRKAHKFLHFSNYLKDKSTALPRNLPVNALFEDSDRNIWIGTWLQGLYKYDFQSGKIFHYLPDTKNQFGISCNKVTYITEDSKGFIWIATHSGGINKFDKLSGKFYQYTTRNGLPNDVVFGIQEDNTGCLWISTLNGLAKFNPQDKSFRVYDQSEGIIHNQFNWRASYKDETGKMFFGGLKGFISFDPESIKTDSNKLPIAFTSFKVFDKEATLPQSLPATKEIVLQYYQNFFSIEFVGLDLALPHKHNYSYMLEGIDPSWINAGSRTTAHYTDIDPGSYRFLVKTSNTDNVWSDPIALSIVINPAWWMTWWFKLIILIGLVLLGFLVYKYRVNQLLKIERIRYNIASDLHDEIGSNLSSISVDGQMLMKSNSLTEYEHGLSSDIAKTASLTLDAMRDIIWFINPKNDEGEDLIFKMRETAAKLLVGMEWYLNAAEGIKFESFSLEQRRNIFLIYKEALTNVIRHSKAKKCIIEIGGQSDELNLCVQDDGNGFNPKHFDKSTGLLSMMNRAEKINGTLVIDSLPSKGTTISLNVKSKR
ncbi:MAG: hypothetical protein A2006_14450 [Ignavibacteria bacterium GWC2_35_8]|nr:MAG: hypothetical protein A2006_14450 [Ignavibacteria bacterium GWC2_35_8]